MEVLNYFNYFTEIEDTFVRRRGKHLWLSPMDWALIETWKEKGVPLHVALRAIERAFDSHDSKRRRRSVKTLLYCQEEVEAQFAEWQESRVGASAASHETDVGDGGDDVTFSMAAIRTHLSRAREMLQRVYAGRTNSQSDELSETLRRVMARLVELEGDVAPNVALNSERIEDSLSGLEKLLNVSLVASLPEAESAAARREAEAQLRPYRKKMEPETYMQTLNNMVLKRLRDSVGLPRLSLFYL